LGKILVRCAYDHLFHARIICGQRCRGGESVVRLEFDHGPRDDACGDESSLEHRKLRPQVWFDSVARLVACPEFVAKRLDNVIRGDADVSRTFFEHAQHGSDYASNRRNLMALLIARRR